MRSGYTRSGFHHSVHLGGADWWPLLMQTRTDPSSCRKCSWIPVVPSPLRLPLSGWICIVLLWMSKPTITLSLTKSIRVSLLSLVAVTDQGLPDTAHAKRLPLMFVHLLWNGWPFLSRLLVELILLLPILLIHFILYCIVLYCIVLYCIVLYCIVNKKFMCSYLLICLVFISLWIWICLDMCIYVCTCKTMAWFAFQPIISFPSWFPLMYTPLSCSSSSRLYCLFHFFLWCMSVKKARDGHTEY
jgi:hypothetical protein